jgi:hypothetical protein
VNAAAPPTIPVWRSVDGGATFRSVGNVPTAWRHARASSNNALWSIYPLLAVDRSDKPYSGRLYCVWVDGPHSDARYVLFSASDDRGATWKTPVVLSEQPLTIDGAADWQAEIPAIAVNNDGVVAVLWYDRRGLPTAIKRADGRTIRTGYNVRLRVSIDGGTSWIPSVQLNEEPGKADLLEVRFWVGLTACADGRFIPLWISDATGAQQLWTAAVEVTNILQR